MVRRMFFMLFMLMLGGQGLYAQQEEEKIRQYINDIRVVLNNQMLCYRYKITMYNMNEKNASDYLQGVILKNGNSYLDSNKVGIVLSADGYVLKIVNSDKSASIVKNSSMENKLGVKTKQMNNEIFTIPDSSLFKVGKFTIEESAQSLTLNYSLNDRQAGMQQFNFTLRKADNRVLSIRIVNQAGGGYRRELILFDFENSFDITRLNSSRYFKVAGNKVILQPPYKSFKISALL